MNSSNTLTASNVISFQTQLTSEEQQCIDDAIQILTGRLQQTGITFNSSTVVKDFLRLELMGVKREEFSIIFMNNQHQMISYETLFKGTIGGCTVHPREVVKRALELNAAAVILAHNHPSGVINPSQADIKITDRLKNALEMVDVRILDHIIVAGNETTSFKDTGLL